MEKSKKDTKKKRTNRDLKPKKDAKGGIIAILIGKTSNSPTSQK